MRRVKTNEELNKKGSPEVNGVRSSTRSIIMKSGDITGVTGVPELTWCYNHNNENPITNEITNDPK